MEKRRRSRLAACAAVLIAVIACACGGDSNDLPPPPTGPVGGEERPVDVYVPPSYDGSTAMPLVILLHSYTITGAFAESVFGL